MISSTGESSSLSPELAGLVAALLEGDSGAHLILSDWQVERGGSPIDAPSDPSDRLYASLPLLPAMEQRVLACDFAEHVTPIFERQYPGDDRPRRLIECYRHRLLDEEEQRNLDRALAEARRSMGRVEGFSAMDTIENARSLIDLTNNNTRLLRRAWPKIVARLAAKVAILAATGNDCRAVANRATDVFAMTQVSRRDPERATSLRSRLRRAAQTRRRSAWHATWRTLWREAREAELDWQIEQTIRRLKGAWQAPT